MFLKRQICLPPIEVALLVRLHLLHHIPVAPSFEKRDEEVSIVA